MTWRAAGPALVLAVVLHATAAAAQPVARGGVDALPAVVEVPVATPMAFIAALHVRAGYAFTEAVIDRHDAHHRAFGSLAVAVSPWRWLGIALRADGRYDVHDTTHGSWSAGVGEPRLLVRAAWRPLPSLGLGAQLDLVLPGTPAPSLEPAAIGGSLRAIASWLPEGVPIALSLVAGFRLDRSAALAPDPARFGPADRLTLSASAFPAVLLGAGALIRAGRLELLAEWTWDVLVGTGAPSPIASPMKVRLGLRWAPWAGRQLTLGLVGEFSPSERPDLLPPAPLAPVPPRAAVMATLGFRFPFRRSDAMGFTASGRRLEGILVRADGRVAPRWRVLAPRSDEAETLQATSSASGRFRLEPVSRGIFEITVIDPQGRRRRVVVPPEADLGRRVLLVPAEGQGAVARAQVQGRVHDPRGDPVARAEIALEAADAEARRTQSGEDGSWTLPAVLPGAYTLRVRTSVGAERVQAVEVHAGTGAQVDVTIEAAIADAQIRGQVRRYDGRGVAASLQVVERAQRLTADGHGNFRIEVPPGVYTVEINASGFHSQQRRVTVQSGGVVFLNVDLRRRQ